MYIHHFWHIVSVQSCVTSQTPAGTYVYLVCTCLVSWVERLPCTVLWPSYLCILCYPLIMPKCWSVAHTRPFSNVCCRNQHLITVAFQYCKAWPYPVVPCPDWPGVLAPILESERFRQSLGRIMDMGPWLKGGPEEVTPGTPTNNDSRARSWGILKAKAET